MSDQKSLTCIILAAGQGTRMKSERAKVLHELAGRPIIKWLLETVESLNPKEIIIVSSPEAKADFEKEVSSCKIAVQDKPLGTGNAVKSAMDIAQDLTGDVLILLGDMPLISKNTLSSLITKRHSNENTGLSVLGAEFDTPPAFGRMLIDENGFLEKIVEDKDCSDEQKNIKLCNMGAFCVDANKLNEWVDKIENKNAQKEFYITDLPEIAARDSVNTQCHITKDTDEIYGINTRSHLSKLENIVQSKLRQHAMDNGCTLIDPNSTYFCWDTKIGSDVVIEPNVFFGPDVEIADNVHIRAFSYLEKSKVGSGSVIGPFARLRPGASIGEDCKIGNFVEIKNANLSRGVKASHLAYIGDADIGDNVNFSCGAITVNYDGFEKHRTVVGADAMIGSNVNLVAPIEIGQGAYIAAGSTVTKTIPPDSLAVAREKPLIKEGWAPANRKKRSA